MPVSVTNSNKWGKKKMNRLANFSTILVNMRASHSCNFIKYILD